MPTNLSDLKPNKGANKGLFLLGPIMTIMPALAAWAVIPFGPEVALANINAGDSEMRDLAERRAVAAQAWLVEQGGVPGERVFLLEPKVEAEAGGKKSGSRVEFSLR